MNRIIDEFLVTCLRRSHQGHDALSLAVVGVGELQHAPVVHLPEFPNIKGREREEFTKKETKATRKVGNGRGRGSGRRLRVNRIIDGFLVTCLRRFHQGHDALSLVVVGVGELQHAPVVHLP